ncbi:MAG: hypothetical protein V4662_12145 [Verrucomicrobiota bacterium]
MSGIIGHTLYAELTLRECLRRKHAWAQIMQAHRASFHAGAYIGSDIQVMPEAVCVDTGREVGFGTVPLERSPITGGAVRQFRLMTPEGPLTATQAHQRFYGRSHLVFGWTEAEKTLRVPWDHLPEYFAAVIQDLGDHQDRPLAYVLGWIVHVVSDSLIKGQQPGIELDLVDGRYTRRNRPVQDLISYHEIGVTELGMDWPQDLLAIAATPVEEIQPHFMRCTEPHGQLAKLFPDGWQPASHATLRAVLTENRRYVKPHAKDEIASMQLHDGECSAAMRERSGLDMAGMRAAAREAKFRGMLDTMTEQTVSMLLAVQQRL